MDQNVRLIEPNMAMFLSNHELKFYNLIFGGYQTNPPPGGQVGFGGYENFLLVRYDNGNIPLTAYPTMIELQTRAESLDYDGEYFWSVQAINDTPYYPGIALRKWKINTTQYGLECVGFATYPGFSKPTAVAVEYYNFPLNEGIDPSKYTARIHPNYGYLIERLRVGQQVKIGPNIQDETYEGTITDIRTIPDDPRWPVIRYEIDFSTNFNTSYVAGHNCFIETRIFVFDSGGTLSEIDPVNYQVIQSRQEAIYQNVTTAAFSVVKNVPAINIGNRTQSLFFVSGYAVYCLNVNNLDLYVTAQSIPLNYYVNGNTFLPIHELRVRNDDPEDINNHPQYFFLQRDYRESHETSVTTWPAFNYVTHKLEAQASFLVVSVEPQFILPSGLVACSCSVLDDYRFPIRDVPIYWSVSPTNAGQFITATGTMTNASGIAYATFSGAGTIPFPTYITAMTTSF
jgi:hypothetical protein